MHEANAVENAAAVSKATAPRLLNLEDTAAYLSVSQWTVRELEWAGVLPRVRVPLPGEELRKLCLTKLTWID